MSADNENAACRLLHTYMVQHFECTDYADGVITDAVTGQTLTNFERLVREASLPNTHVKFNSDMLTTVPAGGGKTYRDMILAGFDPHEEANFDRYRELLFTQN